MSTPTTSPKPWTLDERWQAVCAKDASADGAFVFAVKTTGVYCRPSCSAARALRRNVCFFDLPADAERAGFRACKRCAPNGRSLAEVHRDAVTKACRLIEHAERAPGLPELARSVGISSSHLHRLFRSMTGLTPKQYAEAHRARRVRAELKQRGSVTAAIYEAGFGSSGRFYSSSAKSLGMTPSAFKNGGAGTKIRFAVGECSLGSVLVAATEKGVCAVSLGDDPARQVRELEDRFPKAEIIGGDAAFERLVAQVIGAIEAPGRPLELPLDVRGTAFQQLVWRALREIPPGGTITYTELARRVGYPKAVRAAASACAANTLAVLIPCHRVVRSDGSLSGYRWGVERKRALLRKEKAR